MVNYYQNQQKVVGNMTNLSERLAVLAEQVSNLIKNADHYITDDEFDPVKKIVYGMVTAILVTVLGSILALIIRKWNYLI